LAFSPTDKVRSTLIDLATTGPDSLGYPFKRGFYPKLTHTAMVI